jgi:hypothetical protein
MAQRKKSTHKRRHHRSKKNLLNKSMSVIRKTSRKVIPGVKHGIENVGSKVTGVAEKSVPAAQGVVKRFFNMFKFGKTRKARKSRKSRKH